MPDVAGEATGAIDMPGIAAAPATDTVPVMPAGPWPGMLHRNAIPAAGTATSPVTVAPGSAASFVPSSNVTSCGTSPVLWNVTGYVPAAGTVSAEGVKPRSKASMAMASTAAGAGACPPSPPVTSATAPGDAAAGG